MTSRLMERLRSAPGLAVSTRTVLAVMNQLRQGRGIAGVGLNHSFWRGWWSSAEGGEKAEDYRVVDAPWRKPSCVQRVSVSTSSRTV